MLAGVRLLQMVSVLCLAVPLGPLKYFDEWVSHKANRPF